MRTLTELELCKENVARNIINVALGKPLDMPLKILNQSCKFRNAWDKFAGREDRKAKQREYQREYRQKPEAKAKQREYYQKPEVKAKQREYHREYYQNNKENILNKLHRRKEMGV